MLDRLTVDDLRPAVGETFAVALEDGGRLPLELVAARTIEPGAPPSDADGRRAPFALDLRGPADPTLPQATYRLEHDTLGTLEIFIVPVGRDGDGTSYEAIFT